MKTFIYHHPDIARHDEEAAHVAMDVKRIATIAQAVLEVAGTIAHHAPPASRAQILRNHEDAFIASLIKNTPKDYGQVHRIDNETILNRHTWRAMELSAGAACAAVDAVLDAQAKNAFCPVYAGHHAQKAVAGGFCFINSIAIAAHHALARGLERVAILDIDTHSGNGTILSFAGDKRVFFAETYQAGYPGPVFPPAQTPSNILRVRVGAPWQFWEAWGQLLARVDRFKPQLVLVSAGFDAHIADPLGEVRLLDRDYTRLAKEIVAVNPNVVACLEGGYDVAATARCASLFVQELVAA